MWVPGVSGRAKPLALGGLFGNTKRLFMRRPNLSAVGMVHRRKTMNKGELVSAIAEKAGLSKGQATEALDAAIEAITGALKSGDEVKIVGFGTFTVAERAAGEARNPRTGEKVAVPASKTPKFKAGAGLKDAVNV